MPAERYDSYVAVAMLIAVATVSLADLGIFALYGEAYTISAYLRRIFSAHPAILSVISFAIGALYGHILLSRQ